MRCQRRELDSIRRQICRYPDRAEATFTGGGRYRRPQAVVRRIAGAPLRGNGVIHRVKDERPLVIGIIQGLCGLSSPDIVVLVVTSAD